MNLVRYIAYFCLAIAGTCIGLLTNMAYTYTYTTGFGLHPAAAGVVILVLLAYMWVVAVWAEWFSIGSASDGGLEQMVTQPTPTSVGAIDYASISPFNPSIYLKD